MKLASSDYLDMKSLEPAMRHLLDTYIRAEESREVSAFDELGVVDLLVKKGKDAVGDLPEGIRGSGEAVSETIENNVRKVVTDERPTNPKYYERMSELLDALIRQRKEEAVEYEEYLERLVELAGEVREPSGGRPGGINTSAKRALYDNLDRDGELSIRMDAAVRHTREDEWRGHRFKEKRVYGAIREELGEYKTHADEIFEIVKSQNEY